VTGKHSPTLKNKPAASPPQSQPSSAGSSSKPTTGEPRTPATNSRSSGTGKDGSGPAAAPNASRRLADLAADVAKALRTVHPGAVDEAAALLLDARTHGSTVWVCGNGGSAGLANHAQCDLVKAGVRAVSLSASTEAVTAAANDFGYENAFSDQLIRMARDGDVLVAVSSSGKSPSIIRALAWAVVHGVASVALTGFDGGGAKERADVAVHVPCTSYEVAETAHQAILHALAATVRAAP
jgi:phosphoheptose isomerase